MIKDRNKTAFKRMRARGIFTPPIKIYDMTSRMIKKYYYDNLEEISRLIEKYAEDYGVEKDGSVLVKDSVFDLIAVVKNKLFGEKIYRTIMKQFRSQMSAVQKSFFKDFYKDADPKMENFLIKMSLSKKDVFHGKLASMKETYIDNAVKRIEGEQDELRKSFLQKLVDWTEGRSKKLDIDNVLKEMKGTAVKESRFFARDQFGKFNKSLLIASFREAGVKKVELMTCHDGAVRLTHRKWDGEVFDIDKIPQEWWEDYNCRCGAKPIWKDE